MASKYFKDLKPDVHLAWKNSSVETWRRVIQAHGGDDNETSWGSTANKTSTDPIILYTVCCAMVLTAVIGVAGNLMVIMAVRKNRELQTISNVFIVNLSVCDLLFVTVVLPFNIYTYIMDGWFMSPYICKFIGFLGYTLTGTTIITITLISWNRYKLVVDQAKYKQTFSKHRIIVMLFAAWTLPVLCLLPAIIEVWGQFGYVPMLVACNLLLSHESQSFKLFLLIVRAGVPCIFIIYHYLRIFMITRESHCRLRSNMPKLKVMTFDLHKQKKELHLTRMMLVIFAVFILSYFPCTITGIIDWNVVLSKTFHMVCAGTVYIGSAINPLIYGLMNRQFRQAYARLLASSLVQANLTSFAKSNFASEYHSSFRARRVSRTSLASCQKKIKSPEAMMSRHVNEPLLKMPACTCTPGDDDVSIASFDDTFAFDQSLSLLATLDETGDEDSPASRPGNILIHNNTEITLLQCPLAFV